MVIFIAFSDGGVKMKNSIIIILMIFTEKSIRHRMNVASRAATR
jgi:hypothetical protein